MIDLHMHSTYSEDGEYTPLELVEQCFEKSVYIMSITDHNCAKANEEAAAVAETKGIRYIPGIEIDCIYENIDFHVLGYGIDYKSNDFERIEKNIETQNLRASLERLAKTQALGFLVTEKEMWSLSQSCYWKSAWCGEMFAEVIFEKEEYTDHPLLLPYRAGGSRSDNPYVNFYWDYYSQGKSCYAKMEYPSMKDIISIIHKNKGLAILAHPGANLKDAEFLVDEILALGLDGIEVFSSYHSRKQTEFFYQKGCEKHLLITCGSDYHGKTKPSIQIGQEYLAITDSAINKQLVENIRKNL